MFLIDFPDPRTHQFSEWALFGEYFYKAHDIVSFGGPPTVENLRNAYRKGIFPWHIDGIPLPWCCPEKRAIIEFTELRVPRSLAKEQRKELFKFTIDRAFRDVIETCASIRRAHEKGTWIRPDYIEGFIQLHGEGMAHSVEAWDRDGNLAGGLFGVDAGGFFSGESMFYTVPNASKLAVLFLIDHLKERGSTWLDTEVITPHFKALGAKEIPRAVFLDKLEATQKLGLKLF